jgi:flavin-binding protein dodecin
MSDAARRFLLGILLFGITGVIAELLLMGHVEDAYQLIPVVLGAATIGAGAVVVARPTAGTIRVFQAIMVLMIVSGAVGAWLHFQVNMEFQLEMDASLTGWRLFRKSILAKTPPALAPGVMAQLGLIGLAYTFRHPSLGRTS